VAALRAAARGAAGGALPPPTLAAAAHAVLDAHAGLAAALTRAWALDGCWAWRPLLNGSELRAALGAAAPTGPALGALMEAQARWQLLHPRGAPADAAAFLVAAAAAGAQP